MVSKFHHKLFILNKFLSESLTSNGQNSVQRTVDNLGGSLDDQRKANKMKRLINSVCNFYSRDQAEYPLKVAIFVGAHKILNNGDYLKLKQFMLN